MRILHVVPTYLPARRYGGPMFAVHALCRTLVSMGHEVHVYTTTMDGSGDLDVPVGRAVELEGVKVWYYTADRLRRLAVSSGLRAQIAQQLGQFDIVHTHSIFLWPPWYAARAARGRRVPYVMAPRGMLVPELIRRRNLLAKTAWLRLLEWRNLEFAAALHFTSELERADAQRLGVPVRAAVVIPNGVEIEALAPAQEPDEPYVLHLGRVNWKKGLDRLVQALPLAPAVRVVVAGHDEEGCQASLERLAGACGVGARVRFAGPVDGEAKRRLLRGARALVLPSHSENFGNAVLEAMAAARPVIVTPAVGLAPAVRDSGCGMVVNPEPEALAAALVQVWNCETLRRGMGERGRALVEREYTWPQVARRVAGLYGTLLH